MRLTTWNVNGIRNPFSYQPWNTARTFPAMFDILETDIVVMQELKIQRKDLRDDMVMLDGWDCYFSLPKQKKGYSGVGIYTRNATCSPIRAEEGILGVLTPPNSQTQFRNLPESEHIGGYPSELQVAELDVDPMLLDSEGRCVCLEFPAFVLFGVYSPANSNGLRDDFRRGFLSALDCRIRNLVKMGKRVILVGDLNVSRSEIDTASSADDLQKAGLTHEDYISTPNRRIFNQLIIHGEVVGERDEGREEPVLLDLAREFHPQRTGMYTHWEQKINARPGNFGSRIDYVLASGAMQDWFLDANIQEGLMGSDHCPVYADFREIVKLDDGQEVSLLDIMNPPGVFINGVRQKPWIVKEVPAFSGKLMPEFYQRRSIKDMFKKSSAPSQAAGTSQDQSAANHSSTAASATDGLSQGTANASSTVPAVAASPTKSQPPASPGMKRKASDATVAKSVKKQKPSPSVSAPKPGPPKGQQSLKGFFQPKTKSHPETAEDGPSADNINSTTEKNTKSKEDASNENTESTLGEADTSDPADSSTQPALSDTKTSDLTAIADTEGSLAEAEDPTKPDPPPPPIDDDDDDTVYDPIVAKESWQTLFHKPAAPLCAGHEEPCKTMQTKKKGENQGRSFWMCARPLGPSGQKEKGTQWRCPTFIWCSDRKSGISKVN